MRNCRSAALLAHAYLKCQSAIEIQADTRSKIAKVRF